MKKAVINITDKVDSLYMVDEDGDCVDSLFVETCKLTKQDVEAIVSQYEYARCAERDLNKCMVAALHKVGIEVE